MSLADVLKNATDLQSVYLVEMSAFKTIGYWTPLVAVNNILIDNLGNTLWDNSGNVLTDNAGSIGGSVGYQTVFGFDGDAYVTGVYYNNVSLTSVNSIEEVEITLNSYFWDRENVYINLTGAVDPRTDGNTVSLQLTYYFSTHTDKIFNDIYYQPIVTNVPGMSLRVEQDFSGVGQIAGASTVFDNSKGFFDSLDTLDWDAGLTVIKLGADNPGLGQFMDYEDYETIGTWLNDNWATTNQSFTMNNLELKQQLNQNLPQNIYNLTDYPNMNSQDSAIGTPVPWAYGQVFGAPAVCIDVNAKIFQIADPEFMGNGMFSFDDVRAQQSDGSWLSVLGTISGNKSQCQFTYSGWDGKQALSVDFRGKVNSDGSWMSNASDIMKDLLALCGQTQINSDTFAASKASLVIGITAENEEVNSLCPYLFLNTVQTLTSVVQVINQVVGSYLFVDANGFYNYVVFNPQPGNMLPSYDDLSVLDFGKVLPTLQCQSQVTINYGKRLQDGWTETLTVTNTSIQFSKNQPNLVSQGVQNVQVSSLSDALYWAQRQLIFWGQKPQIFTLNLPWSALLLLPTNQILIQYTSRLTRPINQVFEIVEIDSGTAASAASSAAGSGGTGTVSYGGTGVELTISNLHNFNNTCGFWVNDTDTLPVQFADLAGYGSGSLAWNADWDPLIKQWALQNAGYWTDENGFIEDAITGLPDPVTEGCSVWF